MSNGRINVGVGLLTMAFFMAYGFLLIYLRDFAPGKEEWIAQYAVGKHFESRLAHVHGNLFAFLNVMLGFVIPRLAAGDNARRTASILAIVGLLMPTGILLEVYFGAPPIFVLIGAASMVGAVALSGVLALRGWNGAGDQARG
jgi:hypothetical protein